MSAGSPTPPPPPPPRPKRPRSQAELRRLRNAQIWRSKQMRENDPMQKPPRKDGGRTPYDDGIRGPSRRLGKGGYRIPGVPGKVYPVTRSTPRDANRNRPRAA